MKFYVYEWFDKDSGYIFYVGKGCRDRYKHLDKRNAEFSLYHSEHDCDVRILKEFENEDDALSYEHERIVYLKEHNQAKCNLDNGGRGGPHFVWTDEMRAYKSKYNPMKDPKQRKRMSERNPMKNPDIAKRVGEKHSKAVVIGERTFPSIKLAAEFYNVRPATIVKWCEKGANPDRIPCRFNDEEQVEFKGKRYNKGGCKPVRYCGVLFESPIDVAESFGWHHSTVCKWAQRGHDSWGNPCVYV